jgi:DNA processing protein
VAAGGLVVTEYVEEAQNRNETIRRFIERDRLQAMFSKAVILIASYRKGEGDSGSRHCMQKAKLYGKKRYVMYNETLDKDRAIFGLNLDLFASGVTALTLGGIF